MDSGIYTYSLALLCVCIRDVCMCSVLSDCDLMDSNLPGSSVHGIIRARTLEWVAISSSRGSSQPRDWICISCSSYIGRCILLNLSHLWSLYYAGMGSFQLALVVKNLPANAGDARDPGLIYGREESQE